jgi:hypothetical protein
MGNAKQSQGRAGREPAPRGRRITFKPNFLLKRIDTLPPQRGYQKIEIATAQPQNTGTNACATGPSEVFRIVDDRYCIKHETLPRNRFLLHRNPFGPQWAVTPKLTMIAGRQLSIGAFPVWNALLNQTIAREIAVFDALNARNA